MRYLYFIIHEAILLNKIIALCIRKTRNMSSSVLPLFIQGEVVKGFGRGSKELGCPTGKLFDVPA